MDKNRIEKLIRALIEEVGEDSAREGLRDTPRRVAASFDKIFGGYNKDPMDLVTEFEGENYDEMIICKHIDFYSTCEHHMLPFFGKAHIGYIPKNNRITGLSKFARVVEVYAKRLQVQERLTSSIADLIMKKLKPYGVIVVIEAEHLCMIMRGVKKPGSYTITSAVRGI